MKKHSLFKVILIVLGALLAVSGILAILGYFVPALEGKYTMIALGDVLINFVQSFYYFFDTDRKSTRLNSSHKHRSRMPSSA